MPSINCIILPQPIAKKRLVTLLIWSKIDLRIFQISDTQNSVLVSNLVTLLRCLFPLAILWLNWSQNLPQYRYTNLHCPQFMKHPRLLLLMPRLLKAGHRGLVHRAACAGHLSGHLSNLSFLQEFLKEEISVLSKLKMGKWIDIIVLALFGSIYFNSFLKI